MDQATLNLMLSSLEGSPEESISDNNSLADGLELLDNQCAGNCYRQLQLVLQRANSIIKLKDSQCREKDDQIKLKDSQCSAMKDEIIFYLKKSTEMQNTIDLLKTQLKCKENQTEKPNQNSKFHQKQVKKLQLAFNQLKDKFVDHETNLKEKDNQISKLQNDLLSEANKIQELNENFKKQIVVLEKTMNETKGSVSKLESKAKRENDGSSSWFVPENNTKVVHIKMPDALPFTAPVENGLKVAGPGWLVMQRRLNGEIHFNRKDITDFYDGFGDLYGDFWLGLEKVHQLTTSQRCELFIHLVDIDDKILYARYDHFIVGGENENYELKSLGLYSGNAGDALTPCKGHKFEHNFWSGNYSCNLNRYYHNEDLDVAYCITWGQGPDLKLVQMLIRPK